jgi:dihydroorotase-like cyclic amidohydrolase
MDGGMIPDRRLKDDVGHSHDEAEERMATYDLSIVNADVVLPGGAPARVDIGVRDGRIAAIAAGGIEAERTLDATGLVVLPGLVDEHFHVFRGYPWETYENATRAAIKGGVTAVVDMPLDKPPTLTAERLRDKLDAIAGACHVDYACFGGYLAEDPGEMARMAEAGASAF